VCAYLVLLAAGLAGAWIAQSLAFVVGDDVPQIVTDSGHPTSVVFALDLTLLVPFTVLAAVLLWRRRPWGYVLATAMLVKGVTYAAALLAMAAFQADAGLPDAWSFAPFSAVFLVGGVAGTAVLLTNLRGPTPVHPSEVTDDDR
jgi:hypothetical protein